MKQLDILANIISDEFQEGNRNFKNSHFQHDYKRGIFFYMAMACTSCKPTEIKEYMKASSSEINRLWTKFKVNREDRNFKIKIAYLIKQYENRNKTKKKYN